MRPCPWCKAALDDGTEIVNENSPQSSSELWVHKRCQAESIRIAHGPPACRIPRATIAEDSYDARQEAGADDWKGREDR